MTLLLKKQKEELALHKVHLEELVLVQLLQFKTQVLDTKVIRLQSYCHLLIMLTLEDFHFLHLNKFSL